MKKINLLFVAFIFSLLPYCLYSQMPIQTFAGQTNTVTGTFTQDANATPHIIVYSGGTLIINANITWINAVMNSTGDINVMPGGTLILEPGSSITGTGSLWNGIFVGCTPNQSKTAIDPTTGYLYQGTLQIPKGLRFPMRVLVSIHVLLLSMV